ncbi:MAG: methyltransferase domain-containing protein, partial [Draconibacterium sp.]|nr:methyltransferase domain-containing protein [Draconibacterium sp.]
MSTYVHGYSVEETTRLNDQAETLANLFHHDSIWEPGSLILEAGCGVGAQTRTIAPKNPSSRFISIDISEESVEMTKNMVQERNIENVEVFQADIFDLPFEDEYFDHIFLCFVLEHLPNHMQALNHLKRVLKPGGTITLIEGDHGSTYFHPDSKEAQMAVQCLVDLQKQKGGDANIGRRLYPILEVAGFNNIKVSPRNVYADDSRPKWVEGFSRNTFAAMIRNIADDAVAAGLICKKDMDKGVADLFRTAEGGGTFCYTFFKAVGQKQ